MTITNEKKKLKEMKPQVEAWKREYRDVFMISVDKFDGVFRMPTKQMINSLIKGNADRSEADLNDEFLRLCVLYPEPVEFDQLLNDNWGLAVPLAKKLLEQTGITREANIKKL